MSVAAQQPQLPEIGWAQEIRAYLLGRLGKDSTSGAIDCQPKQALPTAPIQRWWLFEGKRYRARQGALRTQSDVAERELMRLLAMHHPAQRISERPDGVVDWGRTLARGPQGLNQEFVVQGSRIGICDEERAAILGWIRWLESEWRTYSQQVGIPYARLFPSLHALHDSEATPAPMFTLKKWAHVARRSRWPILRDVVAESLRVVLEPQDLDSLPLPADPSRLFELLVLTRVARALTRTPESIRWLDAEATENTVHVGDLRLRIQQSVDRAVLLRSGEYQPELAGALSQFDVPLPERMDLVVTFQNGSRAGFAGIIIEAKSGSQTYGHALEQLRAYRAGYPRGGNERFLVWAVTEHAGPLAPADRSWIRDQCATGSADVWVFSSAASVQDLVHTVFGTPPE